MLKSSAGNTGTVHIRLTRGGESAPIHNAAVLVGEKESTQTYLTDGEGRVEFLCASPTAAYSFNQFSEKRPYGLCDIKITAPRFHDVKISGCQVFPDTVTFVNCEIVPCRRENEKTLKNIKVPTHTLWAENPYTGNQTSEPFKSTKSKNACQEKPKTVPLDLKTPEFITLHMGKAEEDADNRIISFREYIKNIASGIIYPVWNAEAIKAIVMCIVNLAKYRLCGNFYQKLGYGFDLAAEQNGCLDYFEGRMIFEPISRITDKVIDGCIVETGRGMMLYTPYYASKSEQSNSLSVWECAALAAKGMNCAEILRAFFGESTKLICCEHENICLYDCVDLRKGDSGYNVKLLQRQLNTLALRYPELPLTKDSDGKFGDNTEQAVKDYQKRFGLAITGAFNSVTRNSIEYVSCALNRYAGDSSLNKGQKKEMLPEVAVFGDNGPNVLRLQHMLNTVSRKNGTECVKEIEPNGEFDELTRECVNDFQKFKGLPCSGLADKKTWACLKEECEDFLRSNDNIEKNTTKKEYPGNPLCEGSEGEDVIFIQKCVNTVYSVIRGKKRLVEDGVYNAETKKAVFELQYLFGLNADGNTTLPTWQALSEEMTVLSKAEELQSTFAAEG